MRIGVTGPDLLLRNGGAQIHTLNLISNLSNKYNFIYLPNPCLYGKFKENIVEVEKRIEQLKNFGIAVTEFYYEIIKGNYTQKEILEKYKGENVNILFNFDYLNTCIEPNDFTLKLSYAMNIKMAVTVQGLADFNIHLFPYIRDTLKLSHTYRILLIRGYQYISRHILLYRLTHHKNLYKILMVNSAYNKNIKIRNKGVELLNPSNGIMNSEYTAQTNIEKENKIIFSARLVYNKGIFELPKILQLLNQHQKIRLVLVGQFVYESEKQQFFKLIDKYNLGDLIDYKGFQDDSSLYHEISTAKLMIYPSHSDSFSITISQALLLHTPVVAYDIPGLEIYSNLKPVKLVGEFDYKHLIEAALEFLNMDNYLPLFNVDVAKFINYHTWANVAEQYNKLFNNL